MILGCGEKTENIGSSPVENSGDRVSYKEFLNQIKSKKLRLKRENIFSDTSIMIFRNTGKAHHGLLELQHVILNRELLPADTL